MEVIRCSNHNWIKLVGEDENGEFVLTFSCINQSVPQLQMENDNSDAYVNLSKEELRQLRDIINEIIEK